MAFVFPSEQDLDNICRRSSVPIEPFAVGGPLHSRLPQFGYVLSAVEQCSILNLKNARMQLKTVDKGDLKSLKYFIRSTCGLPGGSIGSLFVSARTMANAMTQKAYENFLNTNNRVFGEYLDDFKKILKDDLGDDQLKTLGNDLLSRITSIGSGKVYKNPVEVLAAYNELKSLPGSLDGLVKSAETICGQLAELELSDAKLAAKIQKELNDKLAKLYTASEDSSSVTLNDVAAVLTQSKFVPVIDPLLKKPVK